MNLKKSKRTITTIAIHTSDTPDKLEHIGAADIRRWHTDPPPKGNGWKDIGYNYIVKRNGVIEEGRDVDQIPAHVKGHNSNSIGVVWVGRDRPTYDQRQSMWELVLELLELYNLPVDAVKGHCELDPNSGKTCPVINMNHFRDELKVHKPKWEEEK